MLVLKAFVNYNQIDEVWIHNVSGARASVVGENVYRIEKPEGFEDRLIVHRREDGWRALAAKVLNLLEEG